MKPGRNTEHWKFKWKKNIKYGIAENKINYTRIVGSSETMSLDTAVEN